LIATLPVKLNGNYRIATLPVKCIALLPAHHLRGYRENNNATTCIFQ
jgi:hypothetical protein